MSQLRSGTLSINQSGIAGFSAKVSQIGEPIPPAHSKIFNPDFVADQFSGDSAGSSAVSGSFNGVLTFTGNSAGASAVSGTFDGVRLVAGSVAGSSTTSGSFGGIRLVAGGVTGGSSVSATFTALTSAVVGGSAGGSAVGATFTAFNPTPETGGGGGDYVPNRFDPDKTPWPDKPKKSVVRTNHVRKKTIRTNRVLKSGNDYFRVPESIPVSQPLPVARQSPAIPHSPRVQPRFIQTQPGIGRDVMDALMAVMAVDGVRDAKSPELKAQSIDDDLELVMLIDSISD